MKNFRLKCIILIGVMGSLLIAFYLFNKLSVKSLIRESDKSSSYYTNIEYSENLLLLLNQIRLNHAKTIYLAADSSIKSVSIENRKAISNFQEICRILQLSSVPTDDRAMIDSILLCFNDMNLSFDAHISKVPILHQKYFENVIPKYLYIQSVLVNIFNSNLARINQANEQSTSRIAKYFNIIDYVLITLLILFCISSIYFWFGLCKKISKSHTELDKRLIATFSDISKLKDTKLTLDAKINCIVDYINNLEKVSTEKIISDRNRISQALISYFDIFFVLNDKSEIVYANHSAEQHFGFNSVDLLNTYLYEIESEELFFSKFRSALSVMIEIMMNKRQCHYTQEFFFKNKNYIIEINALCDEQKTKAHYLLIRLYNEI